MTELRKISAYEISRKYGFLADFDVAKVELPSEFDEVVERAMLLPSLIASGRLREFLSDLPELDLTEFCHTASDAQIRKMMVHYTFMLQSYVWGGESVDPILPACIAKPVVALSKRTGQPPILTYSNYVLDNWTMLEAERGIKLDNLQMVQPFLSGQDEAWFVLIHVAIEAAAGQILNEIPSLIRSSNQKDAAGIEHSLKVVDQNWAEINAIFDRMPERCDPYIYFHRVRPWIHGFKDNPALPNGVVYSGVQEFSGQGQFLRGQTGSQSSIVPTMDALLKVNHAADPLRTYLDELHIYRPPSHRQFIEDVHSNSNLRQVVIDLDSSVLKEAYNACLERLAGFRTRHLEYAASYINKQGKGGSGNDNDVGTGGTPFMRYLKKHRNEVNKNLL